METGLQVMMRVLRDAPFAHPVCAYMWLVYLPYALGVANKRSFAGGTDLTTA
jgi:hypothetical protein